MGYSVFPTPSAASGFGPSTAIKHEITGSTNNLSYPAGTNMVYAVVLGGGGGNGGNAGPWYQGGGGAGGAGGAGGYSFGYTPKSAVAVVGAGGNNGSSGGPQTSGNSGSDGGASRYGIFGSNGGGGGNGGATFGPSGTSGAVGTPTRPQPNTGFNIDGVNTGNYGTAGGGAGVVILMY